MEVYRPFRDDGVLTAYQAAGKNSEDDDLSIIWACGPPISEENRVGSTRMSWFWASHAWCVSIRLSSRPCGGRRGSLDSFIPTRVLLPIDDAVVDLLALQFGEGFLGALGQVAVL